MSDQLSVRINKVLEILAHTSASSSSFKKTLYNAVFGREPVRDLVPSEEQQNGPWLSPVSHLLHTPQQSTRNKIFYFFSVIHVWYQIAQHWKHFSFQIHPFVMMT